MHPAALRGFTRNLEAVPGTGRYLEQIERSWRVLDMGGQDVNGTVHDVVRSLVLPETLDVLDIEAGAGVTIVGDARRVDWWDERPYDLVISTEMLEHLDRWQESLAVVRKVLRPGGWFVGTCASINRGPHGATGAPLPAEGEWYQNVDPTWFAQVATKRGFDPVEVQYSYDTSEPHGVGDLYWRARKAS